MRTIPELREEYKKLKRKYHTITCGELREICERYGDKKIYMLDAAGNEVPAYFVRIHDFIYSYRWELHQMDEKNPKIQIDSIGSIKGSEEDGSVKSLVKESFRQWGGFYDVPVYVCLTGNGADGRMPAFGEWTICGDRIIFRRNTEAYIEYSKLCCEWKAAYEARAKEAWSYNLGKVPEIKLAKCSRAFPKLFADTVISVQPMESPVKLEEKIRHLYTDDDGNLVPNV